MGLKFFRVKRFASAGLISLARGNVKAVQNGAIGDDFVVAIVERLGTLITDDPLGAGLHCRHPRKTRGPVAIDENFFDLEFRDRQ